MSSTANRNSSRPSTSLSPFIAAILVMLLPVAAGAAPEAQTTAGERTATSLGLYVTAREAHALMQSDKLLVLIDARPRPAYYYLGHPQNAYSIPARFWTGELNPDTGTFTFNGNSRFAEDVATLFADKGRKILILSSTGAAGAIAVERLAKAGYTNVYNITGGFDGWRKSALPVIMKVNPKRVYVRAR